MEERYDFSLVVIGTILLSALAFLIVDLGPASLAPWMIGLGVLAAASVWILRSEPMDLRPEPWHLALATFLLLTLLSILNSIDRFLTLRRWGNLLFCAALAVAIAIVVRRRATLARVAEGATASAIVVGAAAFVVYALEVQGLRPVAFEAIYKTGIPRAHGTFNDPNMLGQWMVAFLPLAVGLFLARRRGAFLPGWVLLLGAAVMAAAVALSFSRGAMLAIAVGYLLFYPSWRVAGVLALAFGGGLLLGGEALIDRLTGTLTLADFSTNERILLWQSAVAMILDHPWLGVGLNNFPLRYFEYVVPGAPRRVSFPHNIYLEIGAEAGVFALAAFLAVLFGVYLGLLRRLRHGAPTGRDHHLVRGVGIGLTAVLLHNLTTQGLVQPQLWILLGLAAGVGSATSRPTQLPVPAPLEKPNPEAGHDG